MQAKPEVFDALRVAVAKVDALAAAAEYAYDNFATGGGDNHQAIERVAHLVGATREAAEAALVAVDRLNAELADAAPVTAPADGSHGDWT